ncbi:hypothetical protein MRX96_012324 [Rhipicephalus microplus]
MKEMYPIVSFITLCVLATNRVAHGLDCFKCVSLDHENPACEDPFHNNYTADLLVSPCMSSRKNRNGLFPATACIKLNGVYAHVCFSIHRATKTGYLRDSEQPAPTVTPRLPFFPLILAEETGQTMVVRSCALDSGTLTVDTEIVRMSHCGGFYFEDRYVRGCLQSCFEDACNAAGGGPRRRPLLLMSALLLASVAGIALARL